MKKKMAKTELQAGLDWRRTGVEGLKCNLCKCKGGGGVYRKEKPSVLLSVFPAWLQVIILACGESCIASTCQCQVRPGREKRKLPSEPPGRQFSQENLEDIKRSSETELQTGASERGMRRPPKNSKRAAAVEDQEIPDFRGMISAEVGEALHDLLPGMFAQMKEELTKEIRSQVEAAVASRPGGSGGTSGGQPRVTTYKDFSTCQPPQFNGQKDPVASSRWISEVEGAFLTSFCSEEVKIATMTWEQFKEQFKEQYVPQVEVERLTGEFLAMKQTTETVNEITDLFLERSLFCPDYVSSERMKMYCLLGF
ncbi:hypothetical protein OSB04_030721 [Centaurea solstitialis]|uniref:Retrotransposon gag domain-containing protein n=1 Tax=Centaurea solstitialis TaxID=347529 RepID=A0AA38S909_9ASTR|nr:hypothetical protein OSB04_030721 [Centaurea solstitialis]